MDLSLHELPYCNFSQYNTTKRIKMSIKILKHGNYFMLDTPIYDQSNIVHCEISRSKELTSLTHQRLGGERGEN